MLIIGYSSASFGAAAVRRGASQPRLPLVLPSGLDGAVPDHSPSRRTAMVAFATATFCAELFETTVARCISEGLVGARALRSMRAHPRDANRPALRPRLGRLTPDAASRRSTSTSQCSDEAAFGAATPVVPKFVSRLIRPARWTCAHGGQAHFSYCTNYLIDLKNAVIMDVEATTRAPAE